MARLPDRVRSLRVGTVARIGTRETLAGVVTALALVPEVVSFSIVAGVPPQTSLVASIVLLVVTSVLGGRPAMVTAAAGSVALVVAPLVREHGVAYLLPTIVLAGLIQVVFGVTGLARLARLIPRSVVTGFVTGLGVLIFIAQVNAVLSPSPVVWILLAVTVVIVVALPRLTTAVPSPLIAVILVAVAVAVIGIHVPTVADEGRVGGGLPGITAFTVPATPATLLLILPTAVSVAAVGLLESLLTLQIVDDLTRTRSQPSRESWGLGVANVLAAFFGGIGGCAMIGQTVVNVQFGRARTRVSTIVAAIVLLLLVTVGSPLIARVPVVALAGVMMVVAVRTVDWGAVKAVATRALPWAETAVAVVTVGVVVATGNLAIGVAVGMGAALVLLVRRMARAARVHRADEEGGIVYRVHGSVFFGNVAAVVRAFRVETDETAVAIDLRGAHLWDATSVVALERLESDYRDRGVQVRVDGMNDATRTLYTRVTGGS